jgi:hypothetical protein
VLASSPEASVYAQRHRDEWLGKVSEPGVTRCEPYRTDTRTPGLVPFNNDTHRDITAGERTVFRLRHLELGQMAKTRREEPPHMENRYDSWWPFLCDDLFRPRRISLHPSSYHGRLSHLQSRRVILLASGSAGRFGRVNGCACGKGEIAAFHSRDFDFESFVLVC